MTLKYSRKELRRVEEDGYGHPCPRWRKREYGGTVLRMWAWVPWMAFLVLGGLLVATAVVMAVIVWPIRTYMWHVQHEECPRKAAALEVEYRWEDYSVWGWACLARVADRWVPIDTVDNDTGVHLR